VKGDKGEAGGRNGAGSVSRRRVSGARRGGGKASAALTYPVGLRFECQRCSRCCGDTKTRERRIVLLEAEVGLIAATNRVPSATFALPNAGTQAYTFSMRKVDGRCIFLNGTECTVYEARPLVCRFYPFELRCSENGGYEFIGTEDDCPGIGRGKPLGEGFFKELFAYAEDLFSRL